MTLCSRQTWQHFRGTYYFHHQGRWIGNNTIICLYDDSTRFLWNICINALDYVGIASQKTERERFACNETNLMHYPSSAHSITTPLHVSGLPSTHRQEATVCICNRYSTSTRHNQSYPNQASWQSTKTHNMYHLLHIYTLPPPHDG
jgi:hypothetical protein